MSYNAKNYTEQGGDVTHFGGKVIFEEGCEVEGLPPQPAEIPVATEEELGGIIVGSGLEVEEDGTLSVTPTPDADPETKGLVKQGEAVADCSGDAPTAEEYNALLASLRTAGIIAAE